MHPKRNISKLLLTYLISYALLLTLPTAVFVYVINTRIFSALQDQVAATAREGLRAAAERMEGRLDELSRVALGVTQNVKLSPYRLQENEYARIEGVAELRNFRYANDLIYDILYYLHAPRRFYSAFFAAAPAAMFDTAFSLKGRTSSEYTAFLELQDNPILLPAELARIPGQREIDLVQFIYPLLPGEPYATLVFLLDNEKLIRFIDAAGRGE